MAHTGPLPKFPIVTSTNLLKSTSDERGLCHLLLALEWIDEADDYQADDGWASFDASPLAPLLAGEIVADLLTYVHDTGGLPAMRRAVGEAIDRFDPDLRGGQPREAAPNMVRLLHATSLVAVAESLAVALKQDAPRQPDES